MNIYIYSDESGVFDKDHNEYFVFGGIILLGTEQKEICSRKYSHAEKTIRAKENYDNQIELKASNLSNTNKGKLFRSLNQYYKFVVVVHEKRVLNQIFRSKKDKQRYLDYAYKIGVKRALEKFIHNKIINPSEIERIYFYVDEHSTSTNGCYELREGLESEFKWGTYNFKFDKYFPPIFPDLKEVNLKFCNSKNQLLVRAGDIIANRAYYVARTGTRCELASLPNTIVTHLP